jgi:hypothetical protein
VWLARAGRLRHRSIVLRSLPIVASGRAGQAGCSRVRGGAPRSSGRPHLERRSDRRRDRPPACPRRDHRAVPGEQGRGTAANEGHGVGEAGQDRPQLDHDAPRCDHRCGVVARVYCGQSSPRSRMNAAASAAAPPRRARST